ncbi:glycosyltransferase family 2 protein [Caballeronia insecticola]|uniref:Putative glycosyl transferase n=1 Tax=Caballeronia insecticola TaxID=758793 RepID=R4WU60_9BURK|nr:glycosyltransferase [Caballeronia insecticola]BAN28133.1 putative glycosyl transferase [Caballeronia insecticola]
MSHPSHSAIPAVSIITPTAGRHAFLPLIARCVLKQTIDWEWLVHDDSPEPCAFMVDLCATDSRVRYFHRRGPRASIGAKRNFLIGEARGAIIAHFDDDDYYAPHYLADMVRLKRENRANIIKLSDFYVFAPHLEFFGYSELNARTGPHYLVTWETVRRFEISEGTEVGIDLLTLYGFSCVYDRHVAVRNVFGDVSMYEDDAFMRQAIEDGCKIIAVDDRNASCLHLVHPNSTASSFSRFSLPGFLVGRLFPGYEGYPG